MSSVVIAGDTSGSVTLSAPAVAGSTTLTLPTTSGTLALTSNSDLVLLGTITPTASNSLSLGSLTLTPYKALYIVFNGVNQGGSTNVNYISSNNQQTGGGVIVGSAGANSGILWLDLGTGALGGSIAPNNLTGNAATVGGLTNVTTSSTIIYFRLDTTKTFSAVGSIVIYGVQ